MSVPLLASASINSCALVSVPGVPAGVAVRLAFAAGGGYAAARLLRARGLSWTWTLLADAVLLELAPLVGPLVYPLLGVAALATLCSRRWHSADLRAGGDLAEAASARRGPFDLLRARLMAVWARRAQAISADGLLIGRAQDGAAARIPLCGAHGASHTLVVGTTGSGKTVTQTAIAVKAIHDGMGAVVIDPKGDGYLRSHLVAAARAAGRRFIEWTPEGPVVYNPFSRGSSTEIADRALSGERYSEPHYLRQAQRYLGHEVRLLQASGMEVSLPALVSHMEPVQLEVLARKLGDGAEAAYAYLDSLTTRQRNDLAGTRDRLAVVAESDAGRWLDPQSGEDRFDLLEAIREHAVVLFRLAADQRPLLAQMLGAAIVQDLVGCVAALQSQPVRCLVVIDEFSAVSSEHVARLFARARSAGVSLMLGTQEMSDLRVPGRSGLLDQVLGNVGALLVHQQLVPASRELIAAIAGTRGGWSTSVRDDGSTTSTRVRQYVIHPDQIKDLQRGWAVMLVPRVGARVVRILAPERG